MEERGSFQENECIGCDRCGAFIPKVLCQFHKCKGTDKTKRPANISLEDWMKATKFPKFNYKNMESEFLDIEDMMDEMSEVINKMEGITQKASVKKTKKEKENPLKNVRWKFRIELFATFVLVYILIDLILKFMD